MCLNRLRTYDGRSLYGVSGACIAALQRDGTNSDTLIEELIEYERPPESKIAVRRRCTKDSA